MNANALLPLAALLTALTVTSCATVKLPSCAEDEIGFIDYYGGKQILRKNPDYTPIRYDKELFKKKKGRMTYDDDSYTVRQGIDISRHDGEVDWQKVRNSGIDFVILRCAYRGYQGGKLRTDERFHENIKGALAAGLDVGVYVFSQAITVEEAEEEAELLIAELKDYRITMPVAFDPENIAWEWARTDNIDIKTFTECAKTFCAKIKGAGYTPMLYCNLTWQTMRLDLTQLTDYKIWYADYSKKPVTPYDFEFWQYTATLKVPGVNRKCDGNIWIIPD